VLRLGQPRAGGGFGVVRGGERREIQEFTAGVFAVARGFIGGGEKFLDAEVEGPFLEFHEERLVVGFPGGLDADLFEFHAGSAVVAAAEVGDILAQGTEGAKFFGDVPGDFAVPMIKKAGIATGEVGGEALGQAAPGGGVEFAGVALEGEDVGEGVLAGFPAGEAGGAPFGEVLFGDGSAGELRLKEGLDFGQGIEPGEDGGAGFIALEAAVELVEEGPGEAADFAGGGHNF